MFYWRVAESGHCPEHARVVSPKNISTSLAPQFTNIHKSFPVSKYSNFLLWMRYFPRYPSLLLITYNKFDVNSILPHTSLLSVVVVRRSSLSVLCKLLRWTTSYSSYSFHPILMKFGMYDYWANALRKKFSFITYNVRSSD